MRRRVVITGIGAVTPIGLTARESWEAARAGVCGIAPITQVDASQRRVNLAAEVKGFDPEAHMTKLAARHMGRFTQLALVAAREALAQAGARRVTLHGAGKAPALPGVRDEQRSPEGVSFLYSGEMNALISVLAQLDVRDMTVAEPDLEEVFMHYYEEGGDRA